MTKILSGSPTSPYMRFLVSALIANGVAGNAGAAAAISPHFLQRELADDNGYGNYKAIASYSVKFQGCSFDSWLDEDGAFVIKRFVRARMCPASECRGLKTYGCKSDYADLIVPLEDFLNAQEEYLANQKGERGTYTTKTKIHILSLLTQHNLPPSNTNHHNFHSNLLRQYFDRVPSRLLRHNL